LAKNHNDSEIAQNRADPRLAACKRPSRDELLACGGRARSHLEG
jgi:hypothetical protein